MVKAAVPAGNLDGSHAPALTSAYALLRTQIVASLEDGPLRDEFAGFFPELEVVEPPTGHPREIYMFAEKKKSAAQGAATKLRLMEGWLSGVIRQGHEGKPA